MRGGCDVVRECPYLDTRQTFFWEGSHQMRSGGLPRNRDYRKYVLLVLQGFEAIGCLLRPLVAGRMYQAVLRQSSKGGSTGAMRPLSSVAGTAPLDRVLLGAPTARHERDGTVLRSARVQYGLGGRAGRRCRTRCGSGSRTSCRTSCSRGGGRRCGGEASAQESFTSYAVVIAVEVGGVAQVLR
jgi:hypothetical protein